MRDLLSIAVAAAEAGSAVLLARAGDLGAVRAKSSRFDLVTEADIASGTAVVRAIAERAVGARVVVEEPEALAATGVPEGDLFEGETWVVDPLDGTTSFVHGYPCYSVSVACLRDGVPVAGAVRDVPGAVTAAAAVGLGATLDGVPMRPADPSPLGSSLLATGFPYDRGEPLDRQMAVFSAFVRDVHDVRRDGSAALDCCHVAAGRCDGYWEGGLKPWDTAAGVVILREAGAVVTDMRGAAWTPAAADILAASGTALHGLMLERIARALSGQ